LRVGVIGGGWYGCHIACELLDRGHSVTLFERHDRLFHEASRNNQYRLHRGFHYPRHCQTRMQSVVGFGRFMQEYPNLTRAVPDNLYAVPERESLLDFATYCLVMTASGLDYAIVPIPNFLSGIEGCIYVDERVILVTEARAHFTGRLKNALRLETTCAPPKENGKIGTEAFDWVIDATWGAFQNLPVEVTYEPTILLYYEARQPFPAVTLVDGPLCSIYPTEDPAVFTLSSVVHTPVNGMSSVLVKRAAMEQQISRYISAFRDIFRFVGPQHSAKTKPLGASDDRASRVFQRGRVISVLSGKIDGIFYAADRVLEMIGG
jgi:hypothetical protein